MLSKYQDLMTLWHHKPTLNGKPSSNNWMIYSAYAYASGLFVNLTKARKYFELCKVSEYNIRRHPNLENPPISHDEIIGAYCLDLIDYHSLKKNHFVWQGVGEPMNRKTIEKILKGLIELSVVVMFKGKHHRNDFWKKRIKNLYQLAFRLHPAHTYWMKKCEGIKPHKEECLVWKLYVKFTLDKGSAGERNLLWLQAWKMKDRKLMNRCKPHKNFKRYFPADHPIAMRH